MEIFRWTKFRSQCRDLIAALLLSIPHQAPPALVSLQVGMVFRSPWVWNLRALRVTHPYMQMEAPGGTFTDDLYLIVNQPFANANPMTEVATEFQIFKPGQQTAGGPGVVQDSAAVGFVRNRDVGIGFNLEDFLEETGALLIRKAITAAMGVDQAGPERFGDRDLLTERFHVLSNAFTPGENLRYELKVVLLQ